MRVQNKMGRTFEICKPQSCVLLAAIGVGEEVEGELACMQNACTETRQRVLVLGIGL